MSNSITLEGQLGASLDVFECLPYGTGTFNFFPKNMSHNVSLSQDTFSLEAAAVIDLAAFLTKRTNHLTLWKGKLLKTESDKYDALLNAEPHELNALQAIIKKG